jgi:heme-degrading monooxygenase HmoA
MVLEQAVIDVTAGQEEAFEQAFYTARPILAGTPGCLSVCMHHGIETPSRFLLLVEWETIENHLVDFRESERFAQWRTLIGPYFDRPPDVSHFTPIGDE